MPSLQVRDLPEEVYSQLSYLAGKDHRSLAQETIVLLKESISARMENQARRKQLIESFDGLGIDASDFPSPVDLIREDRDR
jgi:plasmid stability protein